MIELMPGLWIGTSSDGAKPSFKVGAALNVATDLGREAVLPETEYAHVGLIDGPGNIVEDYVAAIAKLAALRVRYTDVLVYCHSGTRSLVVAVMYLNLSVYREWDQWIEVLSEKYEDGLLEVHPCHKEAYKTINWQALYYLVGASQRAR